MRIGIGYDAHRLVAGRPLVLGGETIPHETGLLGHSDADVLTHAIMDALLGAAALGDIGQHFPDTDDLYHNACSVHMLQQVGKMLAAKGYRPTNIDAIVVAQRPKLLPFLPAMQLNIATALGIPAADVNIKATTEEKMGFTGREEGMAAHAVVLLE